MPRPNLTLADTGAERFDGTRALLGQERCDSHSTPEALEGQLADAGLGVADLRERGIGGERFLRVTATAPADPHNRSTRPCP